MPAKVKAGKVVWKNKITALRSAYRGRGEFLTDIINRVPTEEDDPDIDRELMTELLTLFGTLKSNATNGRIELTGILGNNKGWRRKLKRLALSVANESQMICNLQSLAVDRETREGLSKLESINDNLISLFTEVMDMPD